VFSLRGGHVLECVSQLLIQFHARAEVRDQQGLSPGEVNTVELSLREAEVAGTELFDHRSAVQQQLEGRPAHLIQLPLNVCRDFGRVVRVVDLTPRVDACW
jgi:hypothetical protein